MATEQPTGRKPPKGSPPKGGARFPRYGLKEALDWASKLVSKTHLGAQPADIVYASVVNSKGPRAEIKVSSLKQYDLIDGGKTGYFATELAKLIVNSPEDELIPLYEKAALSPTIFKALFDTFHGDEVTIAKLKQRAADLNVHPDNTADCVKLYIAALTIAGLVTVDGDKIKHRSAVLSESTNKVEHVEIHESPNVPDESEDNSFRNEDAGEVDEINNQLRPARAIFNVNVNLDSSLDTEKLERQLALLKRYGAI